MLDVGNLIFSVAAKALSTPPGEYDKNGYWGFHGGREIRQLFMMQVQSKGYKFMTSFAMRDVIDERKQNDKNVVFVKKFNPERWDYFRVTL